MCPHCRTQAGLGQGGKPAAPPIPGLPQLPTPLRVHTTDRPPFDCILHPDGTLTAVLDGELRRNFLTFADMCERNWAGAHFELNPAPLVDEPAPVVVQDAIPLHAA
jgi:hypothetical protein